jgi:hypothetical protein
VENEVVHHSAAQAPGGRSPKGVASGGSAAAAASKDAQLAALNNLLKAENNRLRDQALQDATKIKQLQCSLAGGIGDGCRGEWAVCQDDGLVLEGL